MIGKGPFILNKVVKAMFWVSLFFSRSGDHHLPIQEGCVVGLQLELLQGPIFDLIAFMSGQL
jgi:hypothetical protein